MPPRGRQPLTAVEAELIRWWIDQGASVGQRLADAQPPTGVLAIVDHLAGPPEERIAPVLRTPVPTADTFFVWAAHDLGVVIGPFSRGSDYLRAHCRTDPAACGSAQLKALEPPADQLTVLDIGGTRVTDEDLAAVGRIGHLTRLHLDRTRITDAGLAHLAGLEHLEYLNLYGTAVTDAGLERLVSL